LTISEFTIITSKDNLTNNWVSCFISRSEDGGVSDWVKRR